MNSFFRNFVLLEYSYILYFSNSSIVKKGVKFNIKYNTIAEIKPRICAIISLYLKSRNIRRESFSLKYSLVFNQLYILLGKYLGIFILPLFKEINNNISNIL